MISTWQIKARIHGLSSYLKFSNENWEKYEQAKDDEIGKKIEILRNQSVIYQELSDSEVVEKVYEREMLKHEIWNAHDVGEDLDLEVHLEREEYILLSSYDEKYETLKNKEFFFASFVMICYSFIERHLIEICLYIQPEDNIGFSSNKLTGKGVHRAYQFLEKILDYKIDNSTWNELMLIRRLRNNLVHRGFDLGIQQGDDIEILYKNGISSFNQDLVDYLTKWKIFRFPSIELNFEYCQHLVQFIDKLFENLLSDLRKKYWDIFH